MRPVPDRLAASQLRAMRLRAQLVLGRGAPTVLDAVERILAVQAQEYRGAQLTLRTRTSGLMASDLDHAVTDDRSVVIATLNRGTLHLVRAEDFWWLHDLTTPQLATGNARRLREEGVSPDAAERGVAAAVRTVAHGPATRAQLREAVAGADVPVMGQALVHVLVLAARRGLVMRGPLVRGEQAWVATEDWLGARPRSIDRGVAVVRLAQRYLAGHGPAAAQDLSRWCGLPLRDARRGLAGLPDLREYPGGLVDLPGRSRPASRGLPPRLMGQFDPLLHGWPNRELFVGVHETRLVTTNGIFRPFALVGGRAVATWTLPRGRVQLAPFAPIADPDLAALHRDARRVEAYLTG
jgi:Winged helix DNA-binding domain